MSAEVFIEWKERYSVGNSVIDNQHKGIISIINDLYTAIRNNTGEKEIDGILNRLLKYTDSHFGCEELLMEKCGYPNLPKHKTTHEQLTQKTKELLEQAMENKEDVPDKTFALLKDWWIDHILIMDSQYKSYVEGKEELVQLCHSQSFE